MKQMKFLISCAAFLVGLGTAYPQTASTLPYVIYDTQQQTEITLPELAAALAPFDIIFFGEEHNDSVAHVLQYELLKAMDARYDRVALSMEMLVSDDQLILDEYLSGMITERNLNKDAVLWDNYSDYRPMVEYAKTEGLPLLAANAPSRYTNRVTRLGLESLNALDKASRQLLAPLPIDTLTGRYYDKFSELMGGHGGMGDMKIYQSQNLWDATMAYRISKFIKQRNVKKVLHINGRFHSDEQLGTVEHLRNYTPKRTAVANISCFASENTTGPDWVLFSQLGNFVILTNGSAANPFF